MQLDSPVFDLQTLPRPFLDRMQAMLGADYEAFCASYSKPVRPSLRVNRLKITPEELAPLVPFLEEPIPWQPDGFYCRPAPDEETPWSRPGKHPFHEAGFYYIQEASAMIPASLDSPEPGDCVLDLCAAPGGKATQLASSLHGTGLLVANEIHPARAAILSQNLERMGAARAVVTNETPAALAKRFPAFFDRIVVDAPCSGEGMFRKEPDAVAMWSHENVALCADRQLEILNEAARMLRPGGSLTYSTCTFAPEEDEGTLARFLLTHPDFEAVEPRSASIQSGLLDRGCLDWIPDLDELTAENSLTPADRESLAEQIRHAVRLFPHHADGEGHFAVLLHKKGTAPNQTPRRESSAGGKSRTARQDRNHPRKSTPDLPAALTAFRDFACDALKAIPVGVPCLFGDSLYLLPPDFAGEKTPTEAFTPDWPYQNIAPDSGRRAVEGLHILRAGLCLGTIKGRRFEPDHALAMALTPAEVKQSFDVSEAITPDASAPSAFPDDLTAAAAYLRGETLPAPDRRGWYLVTCRNRPLGWGKASDGIMKNHYPKGLRR